MKSYCSMFSHLLSQLLCTILCVSKIPLIFGIQDSHWLCFLHRYFRLYATIWSQMFVWNYCLGMLSFYSSRHRVSCIINQFETHWCGRDISTAVLSLSLKRTASMGCSGMLPMTFWPCLVLLLKLIHFGWLLWPQNYLDMIAKYSVLNIGNSGGLGVGVKLAVEWTLHPILPSVCNPDVVTNYVVYSWPADCIGWVMIIIYSMISFDCILILGYWWYVHWTWGL